MNAIAAKKFYHHVLDSYVKKKTRVRVNAPEVVQQDKLSVLTLEVNQMKKALAQILQEINTVIDAQAQTHIQLDTVKQEQQLTPQNRHVQDLPEFNAENELNKMKQTFIQKQQVQVADIPSKKNTQKTREMQLLQEKIQQLEHALQSIEHTDANKAEMLRERIASIKKKLSD